MKKVIMIAVAVMLSVSAFAQVKVSQGGIVTTYEKGATINIDSKYVTEVTYGNVSISIPKGKKVTISQNKAGNIIVSGYDLAGVKIFHRSSDPIWVLNRFSYAEIAFIFIGIKLANLYKGVHLKFP